MARRLSGQRQYPYDIRDHHGRHSHRHHDNGDADVMLSMPAAIIADAPSAIDTYLNILARPLKSNLYIGAEGRPTRISSHP